MAGTDSPNDSIPRAVDLAEFIEDHSALLVVMGVFAAVAVYIAQSAPSLGTSTDSELMYATGFVAALGLTLLLLFLMYGELAAETGSWHHLHHAHYRLDNLPLAFFTLFNAMLVLSIVYLITRYEPVVFMLLLIATLFAGGGIVLRVMYAIGRRFQTAWARIPVVFVFSLVTVFASHFVVTEYLADVEISTIQGMSISDPMPVVTAVAYILVVSIRAAAALGVIGAVIGIPLVLFDKIRGESPHDTT